jgi:hypothetical protein
MLIIPRFSRMQDKTNQIVNKFVQTQLILFLIGILSILIFIVFSNQFLWILGMNYKGLNSELIFVTIGSAIGFISGSTNGLLSSRNIIVPPKIFLPLIITIQTGALFFVPLDTVIDVTIYGICTTFSVYLIRIIYFTISIRR